VAARVSNDIRLIPSILDRLIDEQPSESREPAGNRQQTVRDLERAVARDLEAMLNTRQETVEDLPSEYQEVNRSLVTYGLPDFTSCSLTIEEDRSRVLRSVERTIARFEPRLQRVRVQLEAPRNHDRGLRFRIDALLRVDPSPEPVTFDAVLQLNTQQYVVQRQG
jgi:type VI secretion system protein ImpF